MRPQVCIFSKGINAMRGVFTIGAAYTGAQDYDAPHFFFLKSEMFYS